MEVFSLPQSTKVNRVVPKNAFDNFTNAKQKKLFTDQILRITWTNKISSDTVNLEAKEIKEIQIFKVELKVKENIKSLLDIIDKSIPYNIIFIVEYNNSIYLSTSTKHPHPVKEDSSVIDWTFKTDWFSITDNKYNLLLKKNIDSVYHSFCIKLSDNPFLANRSFQNVIEYNRLIENLRKEITKLKSAIASCKQFNQKVELNLKLNLAENQLKTLLSNPNDT